MRTLLRWLGRILGGLFALVLLAIAGLYVITQSRVDEVYDVAVQGIPIPSEEESIRHGEHVVTTLGFCTECHGENLAGQIMEDDPLVGTLVATNLTRGEGGIGSDYTDEDWIRAIRHGLEPDGTPLLVMPSEYYTKFSDRDLGDIIAYLKTIPAVDNRLPETSLGLMGRVYVFQDPVVIPAQFIDHEGPRPPAPEPGVTVEYGRYMATLCTLCHGEDFSGGEGAGAGLNLTPAGDLRTWTEADFFTAMRSGVTPSGRSLDEEYMPWPIVAQLTDDELKAIWMFLQTLPPVESQDAEASG